MLSPTLRKKLIDRYYKDVKVSAEKSKNEFCLKLDRELSRSEGGNRVKIMREALDHYSSTLKKIESGDPFKGHKFNSTLALHSIIANIADGQIGVIKSYPGVDSFEVLEQFLKEFYDYLFQLIEGLKTIELLSKEKNGFNIKSALTDFKTEITASTNNFHSQYNNGVVELLLEEYHYNDSEGDQKIEDILKTLPNVVNDIIRNTEKEKKIVHIGFSHTIGDLKVYAGTLFKIIESIEHMRDEKLYSAFFKNEKREDLANVLSNHWILDYIEEKIKLNTKPEDFSLKNEGINSSNAKTDRFDSTTKKVNTFYIINEKKNEALEIIYRALTEKHPVLVANCDFERFQLAFSNTFTEEPLRIEWLGSRRALAYFIYHLLFGTNIVRSNTQYNKLIGDCEIFIINGKAVKNIKTEFNEIKDTGIKPDGVSQIDIAIEEIKELILPK